MKQMILPIAWTITIALFIAVVVVAWEDVKTAWNSRVGASVAVAPDREQQKHTQEELTEIIYKLERLQRQVGYLCAQPNPALIFHDKDIPANTQAERMRLPDGAVLFPDGHGGMIAETPLPMGCPN